MCAIYGIQLRTHHFSFQEAVSGCEAMGQRMRHRGPDDHGFFSDEKHRVVLGHRRLSILDLSTAGRQPLFNEDRSLAVLVNGEIYNYRALRSALVQRGHRFSSDSDSEVIVHLFEEKGVAAWGELRGMYAAAVYETRSGALHLARDPLGIKPLYVWESPDGAAFASEIGAFDAAPSFPGECDPEGVVEFLMWGSIPAPRTHRRGVRAMSPGETISFHDGEITRRQCALAPSWCAEFAEAKAPPSADLTDCLRDSVEKHLASDVPIGVFLSGGIDSGTLAGVASEAARSQVHTISVNVPGHPLDESMYARQTAQAYGTQHTEVDLDQAGFEKDMETFFQHLDLPSIDGLNTFIVAKAAKKAGLTVALSGVGGDELFAGYPTFQSIPKFARAHRWATWGGPLGRKALAHWIQTRRANSSGARFAQVVASSPPDIRSGYLACRGLFVHGLLEELLQPDLRPLAREAHARFMDETAWVNHRKLPSALAVGALDLTRYMTQQLLRDTDVMSMAHSLEVRTPLVDIEVARAALPFLARPVRGDGHPKWRLRQALKRPLPSGVVDRPKQGFVFPWQEWLRGVALADFDRRVAETDSWKSFLNPASVQWWRDAYIRGWAHWSCFWALYVLLRMVS